MPSTADEHAREVDQQEQIALEIEAAETQAVSDADEAPVVEPAPEQALVTLRSKNVEHYPLSVSVVGAELVFEDAAATVDVSPEVAEQIAYSPVVEVVE